VPTPEEEEEEEENILGTLRMLRSVAPSRNQVDCSCIETKAMTTSSQCDTGRTCLSLPISQEKKSCLPIHVAQKITVIRAQKIGKFAV